MWFVDPALWFLGSCHFCAYLPKFPLLVPAAHSKDFVWARNPFCSCWADQEHQGIDAPRMVFNQWLTRTDEQPLQLWPESALTSRANQLKPLKAFPCGTTKHIEQSSPNATPKESLAIYPCSCTRKRREWPRHLRTIWCRVWANHCTTPMRVTEVKTEWQMESWPKSAPQGTFSQSLDA